MVGMTTRIEGAEKAQNWLQKIIFKIFKNTDEGVVEGANILKDEIEASIAGKRSEPRSVKTGRFLNSISVNKTGKTQAEVASDVDYSMFLEYGTIYIPERRHFRNSLKRKEKKIIKKMKEKVEDATK